jgi:hypothetical protein
MTNVYSLLGISTLAQLFLRHKALLSYVRCVKLLNKRME